MKGLRIFLLCCISMSLVITTPAQSRAFAEYFVTPDGSGNDCTPPQPCRPNTAIQKVENNQESAMIFFAPGIYTAEGTNKVVLDVTLTELSQTLQLIGSCNWDMHGEVDCGVENERTIIDGELASIPLQVTGKRDIDSSQGTKLGIYYFQFRKGNATNHFPWLCLSVFEGNKIGCGGGVKISTHKTIDLHNLEFYSNYASFKDNQDKLSFGGGLYIKDAGLAYMTGLKFHSNFASTQGRGFGGGAYFYKVNSVTLKDSLFEKNELGKSETMPVGAGAGIAADGVDNFFYISETTFQENGTLLNQRVDGSAIYANNLGRELLYRNNFFGNYGESTIKINHISYARQTLIISNRLFDNDTHYDINITGSFDADLSNNIIKPARINGDDIITGLYITDFSGKSSADIQFNTLVNAERGIWLNGEFGAMIKNNIIANHSENGIYVSEFFMSPGPEIDNNLFHGNEDDGVLDTNAHHGDPLFLNPETNVFHLTARSPAIGEAAYNPNFPVDIDEQERESYEGDLWADLGADEFSGYYLPLVLR